MPLVTGWSDDKIAAFKEAFYDFLNHCSVNSKDGGKIILGEHLYYAQIQAIDEIFLGLKGDVHDFKILKSRQLGISTITRAFIVFWLGIHDGLPGAMVFDTDQNKENARREIEDMIDNLPAALHFPKVKVKNRYGIILANGSKLQFMSAGVRKGKSGGTLGRSSGIAVCWCSEMCSWDNDEGIVSFRQALSENNPQRLFIWESTARGFNLWNEMWKEAKADPLGQRTIFLGWWSKDSQVLQQGTPLFAKYGSYKPNDEETARIKAVKEMYGFDVSMEQLAWYRRKTDPSGEGFEASDDGYLNSEQPWTEDEAFQMSGSSFFPYEKLTELATMASGLKYSGWRYYPGTEFVTCQVFPAKTYRDVQLKVWEEPVWDSTYVVACDPAFGHDEKNDRTAIQVLRCYADKVEQVAEYACPSTPTNHCAWIVASLAGWYALDGKNQVALIIEINGPGEAVWNEYRSLQAIVSNGYLRKEATERGLKNIFNNVRNYVYARSDAMTTTNSWMWKTTTQLKVAIMERLRDFTLKGDLLIRSQETLEEMKSISRDGDSIKAEGKKKDDRVMAIAMGIRAWEEKLRRPLISGNRTKAADDAKRKVSAVDRYNLFSSNQLDSFFKTKRMARISAYAEARRNAWRYR